MVVDDRGGVVVCDDRSSKRSKMAQGKRETEMKMKNGEKSADVHDARSKRMKRKKIVRVRVNVRMFEGG